MRMIYSQGQWIPFKRSTVESHQSKTNCYDAQRISENSEMDSTRPTGNYVKDISKPLNSSGYGMDFGVHKNVVGPNEELRLLTSQANQQQQMILELQKQLDNLNVIQQQQKLLEEEEVKRRKQAQMAQESVIKGAVSTGMQSENADAKMLPTNDSSSLYASDQLNSRRRDSVHMQQCNRNWMIKRSNDKLVTNVEQPRQLQHSQQTNRVDTSEDTSQKMKQVRSSKRVKRGNFAAERDPIVRDKLQTYSCSECDKQFRWKCSLVIHLRFHAGEKPFKCGECGVAFCQSGDLTRHQMIHSGEKPFKCQICSAAFTLKTNLSCHLLIHTNEKPFVCDICQKPFRQKMHLSDHMNIHSGRKPHKCNVCKKTFRHRNQLSSHRKVHV